MKLVYTGMTYDKKEKTIFLAGPTPRDEKTKSWRSEAIKIFKDLGCKYTLLIPEKKDIHYYANDNIDEMIWDLQALEDADVVMMWIPRDNNMLGLSSNTEFGYLINKGNLIYGRPNTAFRCEFLDYLYNNKLKRTYSTTLENTIKETIKYINS